MKLQIEHGQLIRYETINAFVSILNESPYPLEFGGENGAHLRFFIERGGDITAKRIDARPIVENLTVPPGRSHDLLCDVSRWYDLGPGGNYSIRAIIEWKGAEYQSNRVRIDVVNGLTISREARTLWIEEEIVREFKLCYLGREGSEHLFLSIDDKRAGLNYGVFDLGVIVRVHPPVIRISREGAVKVLHQSGLGRYTLSTLEVTRDKVRFLDQAYRGDDGAPYRKKPEDPAATEPIEKAPPAETKPRWWLFGHERSE